MQSALNPHAQLLTFGEHFMPTARDRLRATLAELQSELADLPDLDAATQGRLRTTLDSIRAALSAESPAQVVDNVAEPPAQDSTVEDRSFSFPENHSLSGRLNDATRGLESTHPELATTLGSVINALSQMGI
jgi:hypothetical protein